MPADVSAIGLLMDIFGAVMIWKYGIPEGLHRDGVVPAVIYETSQEEKNQIKAYDLKARIGVGLLIAGFALQLGATVWGRVASSASPIQAESHSGKPLSPASKSAEESAPARKP